MLTFLRFLVLVVLNMVRYDVDALVAVTLVGLANGIRNPVPTRVGRLDGS